MSEKKKEDRQSRFIESNPAMFSVSGSKTDKKEKAPEEPKPKNDKPR